MLTPSLHKALRALPLTLALLAVPVGAQAATITQEGDALVLRGAPGESNFVYMNGSYNPAGRLRFEDSKAITSVPGTCEARTDTMVDCEMLARVHIELGDQNDSVGFSEDHTFVLPYEILGGDGSDRLHGNHEGDAPGLLDGGPGKDGLDGYGGDDELRGGPGDDALAGEQV
ncbi:MAG: hypothetical protein AVDCRST_MAG30-4280 [uncultured Solirubrobacteraceae bacterium]|uniref:Alkaline phosphatase n=1 Tax=uncultured Solirubrobacteraceae bacterium TaxID=1162706 RepID=A0A6J4U2A0_9ACTN|nr:MAG: hypothetical protein AVDCRST_MAG30-4280 [uncultured Solirubrobacteraceae bacterium]